MTAWLYSGCARGTNPRVVATPVRSVASLHGAARCCTLVCETCTRAGEEREGWRIVRVRARVRSLCACERVHPGSVCSVAEWCTNCAVLHALVQMVRQCVRGRERRETSGTPCGCTRSVCLWSVGVGRHCILGPCAAWQSGEGIVRCCTRLCKWRVRVHACRWVKVRVADRRGGDTGGCERACAWRVLGTSRANVCVKWTGSRWCRRCMRRCTRRTR